MTSEDSMLLAAFVAAFEVEETDLYGQPNGRPCKYSTEPEILEVLSAALPGRLPPLYERLVLSYRWPSAELPSLSLLANPQGPTLDGLLAQIRQESGLWEGLAPLGYIPFGRGPGGHYDPVCFDTRRRLRDGDCPVVQIDHEEILCHFRVRVVSEKAGSFRELVMDILE
jgi:hypothetical protein